MTPRINIASISRDSTLDEASHAFIDSGHSKLPIYKDNIDNIIGVIYLYDLFTKPSSLTSIIKDVLYVPFSKSITDLMEQFKKENHSLAIVLDEHGGTAGLITIEDVFEELFGEFEDEFDFEENDSKKLEDGSILVNAKMEYELLPNLNLDTFFSLSKSANGDTSKIYQFSLKISKMSIATNTTITINQ